MIIAHLDLDAFFASVEELENPDLKAKPLVVGGDPWGRGVVSTANYVARRYGIHSAMSSAEALKLCPQAVFIRPRGALYKEYSIKVWQIVSSMVETVEQTGIDEGYLDLGQVSRDFDDAVELAEAIQRTIRRRTKLSCSLGVATSKVVAKVASDRHKPGGITPVAPGAEAAFLSPLDIRLLPGVGPQTEKRLRKAGINTIGELATLDEEDLAQVMSGKVATMLHERARGIDPRPLETDRKRQSIGHEETFLEDISDRRVLHSEVKRMAEKVAEHLQLNGQSARTITTKVRYDDFSVRTRSTTLIHSIDDARRIGDLGCLLLDYALAERDAPLRLVGVSVSNLSSYMQLELTF